MRPDPRSILNLHPPVAQPARAPSRSLASSFLKRPVTAVTATVLAGTMLANTVRAQGQQSAPVQGTQAPVSAGQFPSKASLPATYSLQLGNDRGTSLYSIIDATAGSTSSQGIAGVLVPDADTAYGPGLGITLYGPGEQPLAYGAHESGQPFKDPKGKVHVGTQIRVSHNGQPIGSIRQVGKNFELRGIDEGTHQEKVLVSGKLARSKGGVSYLVLGDYATLGALKSAPGVNVSLLHDATVKPITTAPLDAEQKQAVLLAMLAGNFYLMANPADENKVFAAGGGYTEDSTPRGPSHPGLRAASEFAAAVGVDFFASLAGNYYYGPRCISYPRIPQYAGHWRY